MPYGTEDPPFPRNCTYFNGVPIDTSVLTNIGGEQYEGKEYHFEDSVYGTGTPITLRVVRNLNAAPVLASQVVMPETTDPNNLYPYIGRVNGQYNTTPDVGGKGLLADELIPTVGCPQYDLCYVVVRGPCKALTPAAGTTLAIGQPVVPTATGAVAAGVYTGAAPAAENEVLNTLGRSLAAMTSGQTGALFPVLVGW